MTRPRVIGVAAGAGLALFAVLGGEYSLLDWFTLRTALVEQRGAVADLQAEIDSLTTLVRELENNPAAQERAAREEFGMIRPGEILYRLVPAQ